MKIRLLHVPDCPNLGPLTERLNELLRDRPEVAVESLEVSDEDQATLLGMAGSPTVLIDGVDPFAEPGRTSSVSCRLYRDDEGRVSGVPSVDMLRSALRLDH